MQSSLKSDNSVNPKFLARGASLIARQLDYKNTNVFRASIIALLDEERQSPLSPTQMSMVEDVLTSALGARALNELNHVRYCDFDRRREEHNRAVADLLGTAADNYAICPDEASKNIRLLLKEGENGPVLSNDITTQKLWDTITEKQKSALHKYRLRQFRDNIERGITQIIDTFSGYEQLHFDPQNMLFGILSKNRDFILGDDVVYGLRPTGKPGHVFSQRGSRYVVCQDQQGTQNILRFSNQNMILTFPGETKRPPQYLDIIPEQEIIEARELKTHTGEPLFFAYLKESGEYQTLLASSIENSSSSLYGKNITLVDIAGDCVIIYDNEDSGYFGATKIVSVLTGEEYEIKDREGSLTMHGNDGIISFKERISVVFEGETPNGKEFSEKIGGWFGTKEVRLSELVEVWKRVALREAGRKV